MLFSTHKKIAAAAVTAVLAMAGYGVTNAAPLPYSTSFEAGAPDNGTSNWRAVGPAAISLNANPAFAQTGSQSVKVVTTADILGANYTDFYNPSVADFPVAQGGLDGPNYNASGQVVTASFGLDLASPGVGDSMTNNTRAGFGMDIIGGAGDAFVAQLLVTADTIDNGATSTALYVSNGANAPTLVSTIGAAQDSWGTYHLQLDFSTGKFYVFVGNTQLPGSFNMNLADGNTIGGFALSTDSYGTNTAYFDNVSISAVPEPAAIAMVGLGSLLMLAKRPKRIA
jgi:hypothetical protein